MPHDDHTTASQLPLVEEPPAQQEAEPEVLEAELVEEEPKPSEEDQTPIDKLLWALADDDARDALEIRRGRQLHKSVHAVTWPGAAIFDLETRMQRRLTEGTYVVCVRSDSTGRVMTWVQIPVLTSLEPEVLEPELVEDDEPMQPEQTAVAAPRGTVDRLLEDVQREALEHFRDAARAGTPEAYETARRIAYDEGYERGRREASDPDAPSGWRVLENLLGTVETLGLGFLGVPMPKDDGE